MEKVKIPQTYTPSSKDISDVIAPAALEVSANYLRVGDFFLKSLFIFTYPRYLSTGWFNPIINFPNLMDVSIFIHPVDTALALRNLRKKATQIQAQLMENEEKGKIRDPILETAFQDIEMLRDALQQAQEKLFDIGLYLTIYGTSPEELTRLENKIVSLFVEHLVYAKPALFQQLEGFNSSLPLAQDKLLIHTPLDSGPTSSFFPFISMDLTSDEGVLHGINRQNNSLIIFDRFSLENANKVVFAMAGAGKSYATKLEILRSLMFGLDVLVIDPENEYQRLAEAVGGSFINISLTSKNSINPFDIPPVPRGESPAEVFRSHVVNLTGLLKLMLGEITADEEALLDRALTETYASRNITPEREDFTKIPPPLLEDFQAILQSMEGGRGLAERLYKFTKGSYAGFANKATSVDVANRFVVFSIRDLEDELRPIAMYVVLNFIWSLIRVELKQRILVIDEAWWMMKYPDSASFLFSLVKRARKYYLGVTTITQDVEDFLGSPFGKPIITNASLALLLKQSPATIDLVQKTFSLTETEKALLLEAAVGEGLFFAGLKHVAIQIIASFYEDRIITTSPAQLLEQQK